MSLFLANYIFSKCIAMINWPVWVYISFFKRSGECASMERLDAIESCNCCKWIFRNEDSKYS